VSRYPAVTGKQLLVVFQRMGFALIPVHAGEIIGPGLLSSILRQVQVTRDELFEQL